MSDEPISVVSILSSNKEQNSISLLVTNHSVFDLPSGTELFALSAEQIEQLKNPVNPAASGWQGQVLDELVIMLKDWGEGIKDVVELCEQLKKTNGKVE